MTRDTNTAFSTCATRCTRAVANASCDTAAGVAGVAAGTCEVLALGIENPTPPHCS